MFNKIKDFFTHKDKNLLDDRWIFSSMLVGSLLSLLGAFILSVEAYELAKNPNAVLNCSINVIINCATVANSSFSSIFGFPNSFLGLISGPVVITIAVAGLFGVRFPRIFMFSAQIFYTLGFIFAYYLFFVGFFVVQAICPWCLLVTLTTTVVFFSITRYNIREENLYLPKSFSKKAKQFIKHDYDKLTLALILFASIASLIIKYGEGLFA